MIGIVGGVGPYAGLDLLRKVYDNTNAGLDQDHLDTMLLSLSSGILDRTEYLVGTVSENPGYAVANIILQLEQAGAHVAGIPCNTAHVEQIFKVILGKLNSAGASIKLLHMVQETVAFIQSNYPALKNIGVLSTTGTYRSKVYQDSLEKAGLEVIIPTEEMQEELIHPAIYHPQYGIKATSNPVDQQAKNNLKQGFNFLHNGGAQAVVLGCTEIPIAFPESSIEGMVSIDPTNVLARALIFEEAPEKLKPLERQDEK